MNGRMNTMNGEHTQSEKDLWDELNRTATGRGARPLVPGIESVSEMALEIIRLRRELAEAQRYRENWQKKFEELFVAIATLRNRAEDAEATALAWNARADGLVVREKEARWLITNSGYVWAEGEGEYYDRKDTWLRGVDVPAPDPKEPDGRPWAAQGGSWTVPPPEIQPGVPVTRKEAYETVRRVLETAERERLPVPDPQPDEALTQANATIERVKAKIGFELQWASEDNSDWARGYKAAMCCILKVVNNG